MGLEMVRGVGCSFFSLLASCPNPWPFVVKTFSSPYSIR